MFNDEGEGAGVYCKEYKEPGMVRWSNSRDPLPDGVACS